jgi:hypothetical protein
VTHFPLLMEFKVNVLKNSDCFWTTNFILLIVLCWTTVFRTYLYTKPNDRKKSQHNIFSLSHRKQKIIFIHLPQHNHLFVTLYIFFGYCVYIRIFCIYVKCEEEANNWKMCFFFKLEQYAVKSVHCCRCFRIFFMRMHMWVV